MNTFGLSERSLQELKAILSPFKNKNKFYVFGSRAKGTFKKHSDLDILITSELLPTELSALSFAAENSSLPIKIDFVLEKFVYFVEI